MRSIMAGDKPRVFADTNVLFSGLYNAAGTPGKLIDQHIQGSITIVVSLYVLDELSNIIAEKKPHLSRTLINFLRAHPPELCLTPTLDEVDRASTLINDMDDAPILAA